jgi:hypothetical protein
MVIERPKHHISAPTKESQAVALTEACERTFTSPTALAELRGKLSRFILSLPPNDLRACGLAALATEKHIFCPDELAVLKELQIPLPEPWELDKTVEDDIPFPDPDQWWHPGSRATKFIPSEYQLNRRITDVIESGRQVGLYFMVADMLNAGHLDALTQAKESGQCDFLILMLTTDLLTAGMKSTPDDLRPKLPFHQRIFMASGVEAVNAVYAVPSILAHTHMTFEIVALAIAHERLRVEFNDRGDTRIEPLDLDRIQYLRGDEGWEFYVRAHLGFSPFPVPEGERYPAFYQSEIYPAELQMPYLHLWRDWSDQFGLSYFTLFISTNDPETAGLHTHQSHSVIGGYSLTKAREMQISSRCPNTSSSYLFHHHPLRSEAEEENLKILRMLQDWEEERNGQMFSGWENPLLHPVPEYAWLTS